MTALLTFGSYPNLYNLTYHQLNDYPLLYHKLNTILTGDLYALKSYLLCATCPVVLIDYLVRTSFLEIL